MKKRNLLRGAAFAVSVFLTLSVTGCNTKKSGGGTGTTEKRVSVSIFDRGTIPAGEGSYSDNRWTRWINEQSGINVEWVPIPRNEAQQKLNMLIASGEAPDIIMEYDANYISQLLNNDVIQYVDEYIEQYSTSYKKYLEEHPELVPYVTANGKMFAFTSKRSIDTIANHAMWIRQDWLDNLNLPMPQTEEEFIQVAKAFATGDPDGNGQIDTMGIAMWQDLFMALYQASSIWYMEDGTLVYGPMTERYEEYLKFIKRLYTEKLIDQEFFTDKDSKNQTQFWVSGKAGICSKQWNDDTINRIMLENNPDANPVPLEPFATKFGRNGLWQETDAFRYTAFNSKMKDPKTAIEFLDWMIDKGWFTLQFGFEDTHHRLVNGVPQVIDPEKNKQELNYVTSEYPVLSQWSTKPEWIPIMAATDPFSQKIANIRAESLAVAMKNKFRRDIPYNPPLAELTNFMIAFNPKHEDVRMQVILGGDDKTPEWGMQQLRSEWEKLGGKEVERLVNEWYQKNKDSLEVK